MRKQETIYDNLVTIQNTKIKKPIFKILLTSKTGYVFEFFRYAENMPNAWKIITQEFDLIDIIQIEIR